MDPYNGIPFDWTRMCPRLIYQKVQHHRLLKEIIYTIPEVERTVGPKPKSSEILQYISQEALGVLRDYVYLHEVICMTRKLKTRRGFIQFCSRLFTTALKFGVSNVVHYYYIHDIITIDARLRDGTGRSLLHIIPTLLNDQFNILLRLMVLSGSNINQKDKHGFTPLHYAIEYKSYRSIYELLTSNANTNVKAKNGKSPIHTAAEHTDNVGLIKILIVYRTDINAKTKLEGNTVLHEAIKHGSVRIVQYLLKKQRQLINVTNGSGMTPLIFAIEIKQINIALMLIRKGCKINKQQEVQERQFAIHKAVTSRNVRLIKQLIKYGANMDVKDDEGNTPLINAISHELIQIVDLLLLRGKANPNLSDKDGQTPLQVAASTGNMSLVMKLLSCGAWTDVYHWASKYGGSWFTAIDYAIRSDNVQLSVYLVAIRSLLEIGPSNSSVVIKHLERITRGNGQAILTLLDSRYKTLGNNIIHHVAQKGDTMTLKAILDLCAKYGIVGDIINNLNHFGNSALQLAAYNRDYNTIHLLIMAGARVVVNPNNHFVFEVYLHYCAIGGLKGYIEPGYGILIDHVVITPPLNISTIQQILAAPVARLVQLNH